MTKFAGVMTKILVVDFNGTSSIYTHYLANGLKNEANNVTILGKFKPKFLDVFINTNKYISINTGVKLIDYLFNWFWLIRNYKKFDVIIIQWLQLLKYTGFEISLINYLQKRIKLIYIVHNIYPHNNKKNAIKKRYDRLYTKCNNIAVQTKKVGKLINTISPSKIYNINHGLFFNEFRHNKVETFNKKCLMIGYISKYKGIEDAIKVVSFLKQDGFELSLEIIGFGPTSYIESLTSLIKEHGLEKQISILSEEVPTKFIINKVKTSDALLLPYNNISQSGVAYTAVGLGTPIVTYDVGNFKEVFGSKNIAEIVPKGDIEKFALALKKVLNQNIEYKENIRKLFIEDLWMNNQKQLF